MDDPLESLVTSELFTLFFDHGEERAQAITFPSLIDELLERVIRNALRHDKTIAAEFFRPTGVLGAYGTKAKMIYMLGMIGPKTLNDLILIGRICNKFAHDISVKTFGDQPVSQWLSQIYAYEVLTALRDGAVENDGQGDSSQFQRALKFTLSQQLATPLGYWREIMRLYAFKLERLAVATGQFHDHVFNQSEIDGRFP